MRPPLLEGSVTSLGSSDLLLVRGSFTMKQELQFGTTWVQDSTGRAPLFGRMVSDGIAHAIRASEPAKGEVLLTLDDIALHAKIRGREVHSIRRVDGGRAPATAELKCEELLRKIEDLTWSVAQALERLGRSRPRTYEERICHHWRIARLRLALGQRQPAREEAFKGRDLLRETTAGAPATDPHLRSWGADLADRLEAVGQPKAAGQIRALLGDGRNE